MRINVGRPMVLGALVATVTFLPTTAEATDLQSIGGRDTAAAPMLYKNCTNLNRKYPHGLGKSGANDRTSDTPVTNFKHSTKLYNLAMSYNRGLDRDKDGIACENA